MKKYLLMLVSVFTAFVFTRYAGGNIFLGNSPRVNPYYLANVQNQFRQNVKNVSLAFSKFKRTENENQAASTSVAEVANRQYSFSVPPENLFKPISKGVSAYEKGDDLIFKIKEGAEYKVRKIEVDGKEYEVIDLTTRK